MRSSVLISLNIAVIQLAEASPYSCDYKPTYVGFCPNYYGCNGKTGLGSDDRE